METPAVVTKYPKMPMKLKFEELAVHRRAALGLLPNVEDPEYDARQTFSQLKSSRHYKFLTQDNLTVTLSGGYRLCRATRCLPLPGRYYWEIDFKAANSNESHIRIGIATLKADLEAPVGCEATGYSLRDLGGAFHRGRRSSSPAFSVGDVVGIGFDGTHLDMWVNGTYHGVIFDRIDDSCDWMPAVSVYRDAEVVGRFVRPFIFDPGSDWLAAGDLPPGRPVGLFSSRDLVKWMKGTLDAGENHDAAIEAIRTALTPPHDMPM
jgi:hypothetical protein